VARYRSKDETDMVWNRTRRHITEGLDSKIRDFREVLLDQMLTGAWEKYTASLETGSLVSLEDDASEWLEGILHTSLLPMIKGVDGNNAVR
jgi:hypothetical protein